MAKSVSQAAKGKREDADSDLKKLIATLSNENPQIRKEARQSLVTIGSPAVPWLIGALKQENDQMRREAVKALSKIEDPEVASALIRTLEDEEFDIRWLAAEGLLGLGMKGLRPLLQALIEHGDAPLLQEGAHHVIHSMAKGGLRKYLGPVLTSLEGVEPAVQAPVAAYRALEMLKETKIL